MNMTAESIERRNDLTASQSRTQQINRLQRKHPGTRRQRSAHGADKWSVQFFDRKTGSVVADYELSNGALWRMESKS